jgi:hypothetical protein
MEFSKDEAQAALEQVDPRMVALAASLTHAAEKYVYGVTDMMNFLGAPRDFSVARILDTTLIKVENAYGPVSREEWIAVYDDTQEIKEFLAENPELAQPVRQQIVAHEAAKSQAQADAPVETEPEETVAEKASRRAFGIDLSDLDNL